MVYYKYSKGKENPINQKGSVVMYYTFEEIFAKMTREEIKNFENEMEMSVNDFMIEVDNNPFVAAIAEILISAVIGDKLAKRD